MDTIHIHEVESVNIERESVCGTQVLRIGVHFNGREMEIILYTDGEDPAGLEVTQ